MRIGVDARLYGQAGVGRYIRNLLLNLQKIDTQNEYFVFLIKNDFDSLVLSPNFHKVLSDYKWYSYAEQLNLPFRISKFNLNLVHFPHFNVPILYRRKFVVTIHDLIHQHFSLQRATTHGRLSYFVKQIGYKKAITHAVKKSCKVITISHYVKKEIEKNWHLPGGKIVVTKEAVEGELIKIADTLTVQQIKAVRDKFKINSPYIYYVGNAHPHKNVEGLIKSYQKIKERIEGLQLVLSGYDHYFWRRIRNEYKDREIIYTGYVSDEEMVALYKGAKVYVASSFEEGFGIPILEAMAAGCPVVSSSGGSLPEIGGSACIYFNPHNLSDMVEKILSVLENNKLGEKLIRLGSSRYKEFSWEKMAKQTLEVYKQCA
ncbi:glycosyltransferase family 4 protein [Candidatus Daviesbacteria bacterium]|nr:glycosyltransferase family 4 protein [Candidatus Daviesbacteria bacterium]